MVYNAIVYSLDDIAGRGSAKKLAETIGDLAECSLSPPPEECLYSAALNTFIVGFREDTIHFDFLDRVFPQTVRLYIILSRHSSEAGVPSLTLHYPGNPGDNTVMGGEPYTLSWTWPRVFKLLTRLYYEEAQAKGLLGEYMFSLEATHHGPTRLAKPVIFIEIGSSVEYWRDERAQEAMARAVYRLLEALKDSSLPDCMPVIGVGGTHYPEKHTELQLRDKYCYGHIFAKHTLDTLRDDVVLQALEKSVDKIEGVVLLKTKSSVKKMVQEIASKNGLEIITP